MTHGFAGNIALIIFWVSFGFVCYTFLIYPIVLFLCYALVQLYSDMLYLASRQERRVSRPDSDEFPGVTFIVAAYNEESHLPGKIANLRLTAYPVKKLQIIFVSDGSTDRTNELLKSIPESFVEIVLLPERSGKSMALNRGVECAAHEILVFSDASTLFAPNAVSNLVRHFFDPKIGVVCGSVQLMGSEESEQTEGAYWRFERVLRLMESRLGATVNASGAIYALRRKCFVPLRAGDLIDDFLIPMNARKFGYKVIEDPEAVATDFSADTVKSEFTRRTRLAVGSFRALRNMELASLRGFTGFAFVSHKLLRWLLPFLLVAMLTSNIFLLGPQLYIAAFAMQIAFYFWGALGFMFHEQMKKVRFALLAYFLLTVHVAFFVGFWRCFFGEHKTTWERVN
jgi:cellulose synthase/poly-beta-1,6-N-acetylglucosamine synthase-like glycosyltransferase